MLQYLIVLLDATSTSFCHYENSNYARKLISIRDLLSGISYAMKENLTIQFVYPEYKLSEEYKDAINAIDHIDIVSSHCEDELLISNADVVVIQDWGEIDNFAFNGDAAYVIRTTKTELFERYESLQTVLGKVRRMNIVITDVYSFTEMDFERYKVVLSSLSQELEKLYLIGKLPQLNLLTDRMMIDKMNNCNAGWKNITLAPDGKFYICPAFYHANEIDGYEKSISEICKKGYSVGNLESGLYIKNPQLYRFDHAKLCGICDAYQCKRCVWLNRRTTCEINIPSHQQCVIAHIERNASRMLLNNIRNHNDSLSSKDEIKEILYLDPFEIKEQW